MSLKIKPIEPNMTEVETSKYRILFSYETPVAAWSSEMTFFFRTTKKCSVTTTRHINKWLDGACAAKRNQKWFDSLV